MDKPHPWSDRITPSYGVPTPQATSIAVFVNDMLQEAPPGWKIPECFLPVPADPLWEVVHFDPDSKNVHHISAFPETNAGMIRNIALGEGALTQAANSFDNIAIGGFALFQYVGFGGLSPDGGNVAIGTTAMAATHHSALAAMNNCVAIGTGALYGAGAPTITTFGAIGIGYYAASDISGAGGIAIGTYAGRGLKAAGAIAIGTNAATYFTAPDAGAIIAIGSGALSSFGSGGPLPPAAGIGNLVIGENSAAAMTLGEKNTTLGHFTLETGNPESCVALGYSALQGTSGRANIGIGVSAGSNISSGENNLVMGEFAAPTLTTGNYNILIGPGVASGLISGDHNLHLATSGISAGATMSNTISLNYDAILADNEIGIGRESNTVTYLQTPILRVGNLNLGATDCEIQARSDVTDANLWLRPQGAGTLRFGNRVASGDVAINGYIEITDNTGTVRRLALIQ